MAKTIYTQFDEMVNYDNIVKIGIKTNWEDADILEDGTIVPDFEMIGKDVTGMEIPLGIYKTYEEAENAVKALNEWFSAEAYAVYEVPKPEGADA
ncbi:MAG: hypothetical protein J6M48_06170 [Ruminococcus sp.]|nr:hypothetical protein [Ruminococcus sp.]